MHPIRIVYLSGHNTSVVSSSTKRPVIPVYIYTRYQPRILKFFWFYFSMIMCPLLLKPTFNNDLAHRKYIVGSTKYYFCFNNLYTIPVVVYSKCWTYLHIVVNVKLYESIVMLRPQSFHIAPDPISLSHSHSIRL